MRKREREKRNQLVANLMNRASVELDLTRRDFEAGFLTDAGAVARITNALHIGREAADKLTPMSDAEETGASTSSHGTG